MAGTYGDMQTRIADELARSDLTSQIQLSILDAVKAYEGERFYFNELYNQTATVTLSAYAIALPSNVYAIDKLTLKVNSSVNDYMVQRNRDYILSMQTPLSIHQPKEFAIYNGQIQFDCMADQTYPLYISGLQKFDALSTNADTNVWTTTAEELIRNRAKCNLYLDVILDPDNAKICAAQEQRALSYLRTRAAGMASGRITPTFF